MIKIRPVKTDDPVINKALDEIRDGLPDVEAFAGARQINKIVLVSGVQKRVAHGLGRKYRGRLIVSQSAAAHITDDLTKTDLDKYLYLTASANTTINLVVF